jgi:hypothetical protein
VESDLAATTEELNGLTQRLADPSVYTDPALVRRLITDHNSALDRSAALAEERDRLIGEMAAAEST